MKTVISIRRSAIDINYIPKIQINIGPEQFCLNETKNEEFEIDAEKLFQILFDHLPRYTLYYLTKKLRTEESYYYECHITIKPVFDEQLETFKQLCSDCNFKVADLLMKRKENGTEEKSVNDSFCTGRNKNFNEMKIQMLSLLHCLKINGFHILRYKIEDVFLDSKKDDSEFLL